MSVPSSRTREGWIELKAVELARPELLEAGKRAGCVGEQIEPGAVIARDGNRAIVDTIIDPMALDDDPVGELGHRQAASDLAGVGLVARDQEAMAQPDGPDGAGQHVAT